MLPKAVLGRKDVIGAAETGSGKTLAYGLPVLSEILTRRDALAKDSEDGAGGPGGSLSLDEGLQALVLCPTRELALQVSSHLREVVIGTGLSVVVRVDFETHFVGFGRDVVALAGVKHARTRPR